MRCIGGGGCTAPGGGGCTAPVSGWGSSRRVVLIDASPRKNTEPEVGSDPDFLHTDLLELDVLEIAAAEKRHAGTEQHRHDIEVKLVGQTGVQELVRHAGSADYLDCLVAGRGPCLGDCRLETVGHEGERQVLVLLWRGPWWVGSQHEEVVAPRSLVAMCSLLPCLNCEHQYGCATAAKLIATRRSTRGASFTPTRVAAGARPSHAAQHRGVRPPPPPRR